MPGETQMNAYSIAISVATFSSVSSFLLWCFGFWSKYDRQIGERMSFLSEESTTAVLKRPQVKTRQSRDSQESKTFSQLASQLLPIGTDGRRRLQNRLLNAGIYSPNAVPLFLSVKMLLTCAPPAIGFIAGTCGWLSPAVGLLWGSLIGGCGLFLPSLWLREQKRKWHAVIARSLSDFLDLMVACLEVGLSAEAALQRVTEELRYAHPRLWAELSVVQSQIELGASSDAALRNFADRSDCEAVRALAAVLQQGRRLGGGMAEVFRQQAESLRTRREYAVEEKAQKAAVKILIPTLLFIFPVIFVVLAGPAVIKVAGMFNTAP